jgi:hypothetical protein
VFGLEHDAFRLVTTLEGVTDFLEEPIDSVSVFDSWVNVPGQLNEAAVWEYWFRENNGWMIFGINDLPMICMGGGHGDLGEPPSGFEAMIVKLVAKEGLSRLKLLKSVKRLHLSNLVSDAELGPISCLLELEELILQGASGVTSLEPLSNLPRLRYLDLGILRGVVSIAPLAGLSSLKVLRMCRTEEAVDLAPLSLMKGLKSLTLENCRLVDLSALAVLTELESLSLERNLELGDLGPLASLTKLRVLNLSAVQKMESLRPLSGLIRLEHLVLSLCSSLEDLSPLAELAELQSLALWECPLVSDLRPLANLKKLESLKVDDSPRIPLQQREAIQAGDYTILRSLLSRPFPEPFLTVQLASGHRIVAEEIHIGRTYGGLLEGWPHDALNERIIAKLAEKNQGHFGKLPVFRLPSNILRGTDEESIAFALMPPVEMSALFTCAWARDSDSCSSALIIVWHQHSAQPLMCDAVRARIEQIYWTTLAGDVVS